MPPFANVASPGAPPSLPAESVRKTDAVPAAQGPVAVNLIPRVESGPRIDSSSNVSCTRSAAAIGSERSVCRPATAPMSLNAFPSFTPMIASDRDGLLGSGGVATLMYARKLAITRTRLSNSR